MYITKKIKKELIFEILLFSAGIASISLFFRNNLLLTLILVVWWIIRIKFLHKKQDLYFFIIAAIIGPIGEIICVHFGAWQYTNPTFLGIPIWLPFVWGLAVMLIKRVVETFIKIKRK